MRYTKGPWKVTNNNAIEGEGGEVVLDLIYAPIGSDEELAELDFHKDNENLISAAPDMYEALRDLIESYDVLIREVLPTDSVAAGCAKGAFLNINKARQALSKAEGKEE